MDMLQPLPNASGALAPPPPEPSNPESIVDPISFEPLVETLIESETLKLALVSLVERIDWNKADPALVAAAIQTLSEDGGICEEVEDWAKREHRDICACCRAAHRRETERKEAA